tara:strand:- start:1806 stop:2195 length:390 start_codon:yes stop_codon:yes gene_type:complete
MNTEFWSSSMGRTLRYILFLPIALISAIMTGLVVFLINSIQNYFSGDSSQWAYVGVAVFSMLSLIYVSWKIIPGFRKTILYSLFGLRVIFSIIWFLDPSTSPLSLGMLILQELMVTGASLYLINKLLTD